MAIKTGLQQVVTRGQSRGLYILLLLLANALCFGCAYQRNDEVRVDHSFDHQVGLQATGERIYFLLDSLSPINAPATQYIELDGKGHLFRFNPLVNTIYGYIIDSAGSSAGVLKVPLAKEGPNGVGAIRSFHVHNLDSIFLRSTVYPEHIFLVNQKGEVKSRYPLFPDGKGNMDSHSMSELSSMVYHEGMLFVPARFPLEPHVKWNKEFKSNQVVGLNLETGEARQFLNYEHPYTTGAWGSEFFDMAMGYHPPSGQLIFGHKADHFIKTFSLEGVKVADYYAGSFYLKDLGPLVKKGDYNPSNMLEHAQKVISNGDYGKLVHDSYRNATYRFAHHPIPKEVISNTSNIMSLRASVSVVILNEQFTKIGETELDIEKYGFSIFANKKGIYVLDQSSQSEDTLFYERFELQPIMP